MAVGRANGRVLLTAGGRRWWVHGWRVGVSRGGKREKGGVRAVASPPLEGLGWLAGCWSAGLLHAVESAQPRGIAVPGFGVGDALQSRLL